ncbi:type III restriction protein res subunit, partial [Pseudomonas syringae pv. actinidiae ICMP 19068]
TPKDQRILDFLDSAGKSDFESFAVSRDDVVDARLNKRYIEAIIYDLAQSVQSVADLKRTVLRQAWKRNQDLKQRLADAGIPLTPLLLVQVANGNKTVEEAEQDLIHLCKVPPGAIGKHSSDDPDPVLMAAIANDSSKEVLIFKQSAGALVLTLLEPSSLHRQSRSMILISLCNSLVALCAYRWLCAMRIPTKQYRCLELSTLHMCTWRTLLRRRALKRRYMFRA